METNNNSKLGKTTKIFFDCEFTGLHQNTTLISIGMVTDDNRYFYAELVDYDKSQLNDWLMKNVIANLRYGERLENEYQHGVYIRRVVGDGDDYSLTLQCDKTKLRRELDKWLAQFGEVKIISDCLAYDWVLFCEIFGGAMNLPKNIYYIPFDLSTMFYEKGIDPDIDREKFADFKSKYCKHNSLHDAGVIRECYYKLQY